MKSQQGNSKLTKMEAVKAYDQFLFSYDVLRNLNTKPHKRRLFNIKGSKIYWDHNLEKYVRIGEGLLRTYTFYKTKDLSKKGENIRVRHTTTFPGGARTKAWFKDQKKAESGLKLYAVWMERIKTGGINIKKQGKTNHNPEIYI